MQVMRIGVIDVGSNTTRLLVASAGSDGLVPLEKQKVRLSLGEEIERFGAVSAVHRAAAVKAVRELASTARRSQVASLDVFLTAPGRQASNAAELVAALSRAAGVQARVLTKEEEGTLAYRGAVLTAGVQLPTRVAVCDIGGASTEIAVGPPAGEPDWIESVDLGSVRLTTRSGDMHSETESAFSHIAPPRVEAALAVGGSARATRRLVGATLGGEELVEALRIVETTPPREVARCFGVDRARADILLAGVILLAEVQRKLGVPLHVCDGGIREGAVLASLDALSAQQATSAAGTRARRSRR
jgi:exopolyphosphatase / guanosine-5'-triphosphate,3'-diphosphate pyrophosphatase